MSMGLRLVLLKKAMLDLQISMTLLHCGDTLHSKIWLISFNYLRVLLLIEGTYENTIDYNRMS